MSRRLRKEANPTILPKLLLFGGAIIGGYILFKVLFPKFAAAAAMQPGTTTMPIITAQEFQQIAQAAKEQGAQAISIQIGKVFTAISAANVYSTPALSGVVVDKLVAGKRYIVVSFSTDASGMIWIMPRDKDTRKVLGAGHPAVPIHVGGGWATVDSFGR